MAAVDFQAENASSILVARSLESQSGARALGEVPAEDRQLGPAAEGRFNRSVVHGDLAADDVTPADWQPIAELVDAYADLALGGVDAMVPPAGSSKSALSADEPGRAPSRR